MRDYGLKREMYRGKMFEYLNQESIISGYGKSEYYELFQVLEEYNKLIINEIGEEKAKKLQQKLSRIYAKKTWKSYYSGKDFFQEMLEKSRQNKMEEMGYVENENNNV